MLFTSFRWFKVNLLEEVGWGEGGMTNPVTTDSSPQGGREARDNNDLDQMKMNIVGVASCVL